MTGDRIESGAAAVHCRPLPNPIALAVEDVTKSFGSIVAIQGVSLEVAAGRVTALVGDNGAGKSTLVKMHVGLVAPDIGSVLVDGRPVDACAIRVRHASTGIHTVFQDLGLVGQPLDRREHVPLHRDPVAGYGNAYAVPGSGGHADAARKALDNLGITTVRDIDAPVELLSGGQRQSVAIARAVRERARL